MGASAVDRFLRASKRKKQKKSINTNTGGRKGGKKGKEHPRMVLSSYNRGRNEKDAVNPLLLGGEKCGRLLFLENEGKRKGGNMRRTA